MNLLAFQEANIWRWQSLFEARASYEVKGYAANTEFGSMTFDELWTLDKIFYLSFILLSTLVVFQNIKTLLMWSIYANLMVI